jgi:hypothetical protein
MISNIPQASAGQNSEQTQKAADGVQILYLSMVHGLTDLPGAKKFLF